MIPDLLMSSWKTHIKLLLRRVSEDFPSIVMIDRETNH